jgi:hypothetical protein
MEATGVNDQGESARPVRADRLWLRVDVGLVKEVFVDGEEPNMVIIGHARLFGDLLDDDVLTELRKVGQSPDNQWGALFIYERNDDGSRTKWTLMTADFPYAEMLASRVGRIELSTQLLRERFPAFQKGWVIDDDDVACEDAE